MKKNDFLKILKSRKKENYLFFVLVFLYLYYVYYLFISLAAFIYSGEPAPYFFLTCASFALPFNGGAFGFFGFDDLDADGLFFVLLFD